MLSVQNVARRDTIEPLVTKGVEVLTVLQQHKVGVNKLEGVKLMEGVKLSIKMINQGVGKGRGHRSRWVVASLHQDRIAFVFDASMLLY